MNAGSVVRHARRLAPALLAGLVATLINVLLAIPLYPGAAVRVGAIAVFALALLGGLRAALLAAGLAAIGTMLATGDAVPLWAYPIEAALVASLGRSWHPVAPLLAFWLLFGLPALALAPFDSGVPHTTAALVWPTQELLAVLAAQLVLMLPAVRDALERAWPGKRPPSLSVAGLLTSFVAFLLSLALGGTAWIQARQAYEQAASEVARQDGVAAAAVARQLALLRDEYGRALMRTATTPSLLDGERPEVEAAFVLGPDGRVEHGWRERPREAGARGPSGFERLRPGHRLAELAPPGGWPSGTAGRALRGSWRVPAGNGRDHASLVLARPLPAGRLAAIVIDLPALERLVTGTALAAPPPTRIAVRDARGELVFGGVPADSTGWSVASAAAPVTGWRVEVATPASVLRARAEEALRRALPLMAGLMTLLGALGVALAGLFARELRRLDRATRDLVRQALEGKEPDRRPPSGLAEFQGLFRTLGLVGRTLGRAVRAQRAREAELAMANAQLKTTVEELRGVDRSRSEVLHAIGHDIKIPLTAVIGYAELLEDQGGLGEQQRGFIHGISENAARVVRLLEDLLDLARMEVGRFAIEPAELEPAEFLEHIARQLRPLAERKGVTLRVDTPPGLPTVWADPARFDQVLTNLVSNAIKFTPSGGRVRMRAHRAPDQAAVVVEIVDDGPGIAPEHLPKLFTRFYRVEGTRQPGTGLGLAISRKLVEAMGGTIGVLSEPKRGSTFWFTLPTAAAAAPARQEAGAAEA